MELTFLGGAGEVGRLSLFAEVEGSRLLFDYGMAPRDPPEYPMEAPPVDLALLTHAHLDHAGMLPWLVGRYNVPVVARDPTRDLATLLNRDSLKVARKEGYPEPYTDQDVHNLGGAFRTVTEGERVIEGGLEVEPRSAGHIPGSTMYRVQGGADRLLFTGDLNTRDTRLVAGCEPASADVVVVESTYAGDRHPDRDGEERRFLDAVEETVARGGTAVVPAFATGRTQEVLLVLADAGYEPFVDGMGRQVLDLFRRHPGAVRDADALDEAARAARPIGSHRDRDRVLDQPGEVVVTTSGMLDGGPVLHYLDRLRSDAASSVLLTGYQVEGSNGRRLLEEGVVEIEGVPRAVAPSVDRFHFSSHADHDDLVAFVEGCDPETAVLCHGERREELARDLNVPRVAQPETGETLVLR